jgi:two-component sensor histidine kinase
MFLGGEAEAGLRGASTRLRLALAKCHADLIAAEDAACDGEDLEFDEAEATLLGLRQKMLLAAVNLQAGRRVLEQATRHAAAVDNALEELAGRSSSDGEVLAREADHRVTNSLQTIFGLLQLQAERTGNPAVQRALRRACTHIRAVAKVHEALSSSADLGMLDLGAYLRELCASLIEAQGDELRHRTLTVQVESASVPVETARAIGLAVAELVANAFRHGFPADAPGAVRVEGIRLADNRFRLSVSDNGRGLPVGFDLKHRPSGLGLREVSILADRVRGRMEASGRRQGARFTLTFCLPWQ